MRTRERLAVAAWAGAVFGILEGVVLCVCRLFPAVLAPYKVPLEGLWVAAFFNIALFLPMGAFLPLAFLPIRRFLRGRESTAVYAVFAFAGLVGVITAPAVLHPAAAVLLAAGITASLSRALPRFESRLTGALSRRVGLAVAIMPLLAVGVAGYKQFKEWALFRSLPPVNGKTNALVIVLDTVRSDMFRQTGSLTPNLDSVLGAALRYDNAWATSSWSLVSQASILTGRYAHQHGADWPALSLNPDSLTLAGFFSRRGYVTGAFSGNTAWVTPEYLGRGFLRFESQTIADGFRRTVWGRKLNVALGKIGLHDSGRGKTAPTVTRQFFNFVDRYPSHPFFAYLCYMDANQSYYRKAVKPFWAPVPGAGEIRAAFDQGLRKLDGDLGDLFRGLKERGLDRNTIVIVTSDHGQSLGAKGTRDHDPPDHGTSLYVEQTRVPLFLSVPGKDFQGASVSQAVSIAAIPATVAWLFNTGEPSFRVPALPVPARPVPVPPVLMTLQYESRNLEAIASQGHHFIRKAGGGDQELFELATDPLERRNLALHSPATETFRDMLDEALGLVQAPLKQSRLSGSHAH